MSDSTNRNDLLVNVSLVLVLLLTFFTVGYFMYDHDGEKYVYFDTHKLLNAQRTASITIAMSNPESTWRIQSMNAKIERDVQDVIRMVADGAVVLSKSSVVLLSDYRDITDDVLRLLNLPTDVPDVDSFGISPQPDSAAPKAGIKDYNNEGAREKYLP